MPSRHLTAWFALMALAAPLCASPLVPAVSSAQPILDGLAGKHRVIGFTERGGKRFLGRVVSGDHGLYIVQTFHYASALAATTETTTQTGFVSGRFGRLRPASRRVKTQVTSQKAIADEVAVRALLSGVAGPSFRPVEQPAQRELVAPADVTCLQELLPPPLAAFTPLAVSAGLSASSASAPAAPPSTVLPGTPAATRPAAGWVLKTLWAAPK